MADAKTIDNLGIDTSVRWAKDQNFLDDSFIKESLFISKQTTIDSIAPSFSSQFDVLFQMNKRFIPWAFLVSPEGYHLQKMRLFTHQSIPSLGSNEFLSVQLEKIKDKVNALQQGHQQKSSTVQGSNYRWEKEQEEKEEKEEAQALITFLDYLQRLDATIIEINCRRSQYQKG